MGAATSIQWTGSTFNPWWGCQRVSPGCERCYAETFAHRLGLKVWGPTSDRRFFGDKHWNEPVKWNSKAEKAGMRQRVFCASMADVFEDRRDLDAERARLFGLIERTPWLDWQLLTKRPQNMTRLAPESWAKGWPENVWAGCTAEDQTRLNERVSELLKVPAKVRFLSCEPLVGSITFRWARWAGIRGDHLDGLNGIHQIILGGESGHGARLMEIPWVRNVISECRESKQNPAVFVKQLGSAHGLKDSHGGDWSEWPEDIRIREFPSAEQPA
jgi:protein gp37